MRNLITADTTANPNVNLVNALVDLLFSTRMLEYIAHQFHWNIVGNKFQTMHEFYQEEYEQLFKDQDEVAEQIRQLGYFVPVQDNFVLDDSYKASEYEAQLIAYGDALSKNIDLIKKVNVLSGKNIVIQDMCARLEGLRSLSLNLKVKAMLKTNTSSLNEVATAATKTNPAELKLKSKGFKFVEDMGYALPKKNVVVDLHKGFANVTLVMDDEDFNVYQMISNGTLFKFLDSNIADLKKFDSNPDANLLSKFDAILNKSQFEVTASTLVTAGYDKGRYKEIMKESEFFKILREKCGIANKHFYAVNKGMRLAIRIIKDTFEDASIRFFALKGKGGYVRVELGKNVYIVGYTIFESGKVKVWTRVLKTALAVNSFDYEMLNIQAKPFGTKLPSGLMPTWLSL